MLLLAALLASASVLHSQTRDLAVIEGSVVDGASSQPLSHAQVILTKTGGVLRDTLSALSDDSGKFTIRDITSGDWRLFVEHDGYLRTEYGQRAPGKLGVPISTATGQSLKLVVSMTATGALHGRVVNEYGEPLRNALVKALTPRYADGRRSIDSIKSTTTNDLGEFRLFGLTPGRYYLSAEKSRAPQILGNQLRMPNNTIPASTSVVPPSAFSTGIDLVTYYSNANSERGAVPIEVRSGVTTDVGDLLIRHTEGLHVRGKVVVESTAGQMPDFRVDVWRLGGQVVMNEVAIHSQLVKIAPGSNEGAFDIAEFAPGVYTIEASTGRGAENILSGEIDVEVGNVDLNGLNIVVAPRLKTVVGRIAVDGRGPVSNNPDVARITFILRGGAGAVRVQPDGAFALSYVVPGLYTSSRISLMGLPAGWFIKSARVGDTDILKNGLGLSTPPQTPIEIVVSPNGAIVDTVVFDDVRKPMQGVRVVLVPDEARRGRYELYQSIMSDLSGRAHFVGVPPGNYTLFAWDDVLVNQWQDAEFLRTQESRGAAITIREGEHREIEIKVIAGGQ